MARWAIAGLAAAGLVGVAACTDPVAETGAADYATYCASCHGAEARGDGPAARGQTPPPADLTVLSRRNGGTFPMIAVLGQIDGYGRGVHDMPAFGALLKGDTVMLETDPAVMTPTPARLVALADYLETLQR